MRCEYCDEDVERNKKCKGCGAKAVPSEWEKSEPFEYKGFIVWALKSAWMQTYDFCFYQGRTLVNKVRVTYEEKHQHVLEGETMMPYVFEKLQMNLDIVNER